MKLLKEPKYPTRRDIKFTADIYSGMCDITELRGKMEEYLIRCGYTAEELQNLLKDEDIYVTHSSGYHMEDCWELELECDIPEPEDKFMERVEKYQAENLKYTAWYESNKDKIEPELERREIARVKKNKAAQDKRDAIKAEKKLKDIAKLEAKLNLLKKS